MSEFFEALNDKHVEMIGKQPVFFVATAAADGRINLSPKGYDSFRILSPDRVEWNRLASHFEILPGTQQIILADVDSVQTSCGWGVPFMAFDRERETLKKAHAGMDADAWMARAQGRTKSIDGIATRVTDRYFGPAD